MIKRGCEAVGIDLGTTYSSLAYMDSQITPRMMANSAGQNVIPSVIYFDEDADNDDEKIIVGEVALEQAKLASDRVVQFIKVQMGEEWSRVFLGHRHTPESLSAIILGHLVKEAEPQFLDPIRRAVITVPAYFTEKRRRATQQAGEIAGLEVIGTLNEPMAATLSYGLNQEDCEQNVVVYDLGGGTFDVTVVHVSPDHIEELATDGNLRLGGRDWDECLIDYVADSFKQQHACDPREDRQALQDLYLECERAKRRLSSIAKTSIRVHAFHRDHSTEITREKFQQISVHLVQSTRLTVEMALDEAGLTPDKIARVVLVGGSTHLPAVRQMLTDTFGFAPDKGVNPVVAVALGAATYAYMLESGQGLTTRRLEHGDADQQPVFNEDLESLSDTLPPETTDETADTMLPPERNVPSLKLADAVADAVDVQAEPFSEEPVLADEPSQKLPNLDPDAPDFEETITESPPSDSGPFNLSEVSQPPDSNQPPSVSFVTAHGVGLKVKSKQGWRNTVLIPGNTRVPASISRQFFTAKATSERTHIQINITQGDTEDIEVAELLGTGRIHGFPPNEPAGQAVEVSMEFDEQGRLDIHAVYVNTGQEMQMTLEIPGGLSREEMQEHHEHLKQSGFVSKFVAEDVLAKMMRGSGD